MRRMVFSLIALVSGVASAGTQSGIPYIAQSSYASNASNAGYMFLFVNGGTKTGSPACATINGGTRWVINNTWPASKLQMSIILTAIAMGKSVTFIGSNDCGVWGDSETVVDIQLSPT